MPPKSYNCNGCKGPLPRDKPRIHCQICDEYNSCAECHVIESFSGLHSASHDYEIFLNGDRVLTKEGKKVQKLAVRLEQKPTPPSPGVPRGSRPSARSFPSATGRPDVVNTAEQYWGSVIVEDTSFRPIFTRLLAAIFNYFDNTVQPLYTRWMEPSKFRAALLAAGYSTQDVPLPTYSIYLSPLGSDIHELDQTLSLVFRGLNVEHRMATRDSLLSPYHEPFGDALRANSVPNSMPMLSRRGFEQYILFQIRVDPTETSARINHLLQSLPPLLDSETKQLFTHRHIPRNCFPPLLDPTAEELRRSVEKQRRTLQAWKEAREVESAWRQPALGDDFYNKMMPGDFRPMSAAGWRTTRGFAGGF